jgi:arginine N-succinyltransferase
MEMAVLSGRGFTSLPTDTPTLRQRLATSEASFEGHIAPIEAWYTIMLENSETGEIAGVAGVKAGVGLKRPHFSFRVVTLAQSSPAIGMRFDHQALVLVNECSGWSEVGSLFLKPEHRKGGAGRLLAQSRYMLIGSEPHRFADTVLAELRGWFDEDDTSPFWEAVGNKFFRLPFDEADLMSASSDGQFILDLAPRHPIYTELLPEKVRETIGQVHKQGQAAKAMLETEGFRFSGLVDIFDVGPTVSCPRDDIRSVRDARVLSAQIVDSLPEGAPDLQPALISTTQIARFRAVRATVVLTPDGLRIDRPTATALGVNSGELVRVKL